MSPRGRTFTREQAPVYPAPDSTTAGRSLWQQGPSFAPRWASDLAAARDLRQLIERHGITPISEIIRDLRAHNTPPQLVQVGYPGLITGLGVANAIMLVPKNPDRMSLLVCNPTQNSAITFSYDAPVQLGAIGLGNPVQAQSQYPESNGSVSINAIWCWTDNALATLPIPLIAYEGVLSIVGNKR